MPYENTRYRRFGDTIIAVTHDSGRWVWAAGIAFPNSDIPLVPHDGALFFRTDLAAHYVYDAGTWTAIGGGGAPTDAEYVTSAIHADLSAERVLTDTATVTWDFTTPGQAKASAAAAPAPDTDAQQIALLALMGF